MDVVFATPPFWLANAMTLVTPAPSSEVSAATGRRSACRKPIRATFRVRLAESCSRPMPERSAPSTASRSRSIALSARSVEIGLDANPCLGFGHERAQLEDERRSRRARTLEPLDPVETAEHGAGLVHAPTVAREQRRESNRSVTSSYTRGVTTCASCGTENPAHARFCLGVRLAARRGRPDSRGAQGRLRALRRPRRLHRRRRRRRSRGRPRDAAPVPRARRRGRSSASAARSRSSSATR